EPRLLRFVMTRWKALTDSATADDPLLAPWHALAALASDEGFTDKAAEVTASWKTELEAGPSDPTRSLVLQAVLGDKPPDSLVELARRYGNLLARAASEPDNPELEKVREWLA